MADETQEAPKVHFHMSEGVVNSLTWEEYEALEMAQEGELKLRLIRPLLARFVVDGENKPMDHARAMKLLAKLQITQVKSVLESFMEALKEKAVPKENGD